MVDRAGLGALSMRSVASELGVGAMSLYRYVSGREEIERLIVDHIFQEVDPVGASRGSWRNQITALSASMRSAISIHPDVIPLLLVHFQRSPSAWRWLNSILKALTQAGFDPKQRVVAVRTLQAYVIGAAQGEFLVPLDGAATSDLTALPLEEFALVVETAQAAFSISADQEFSRGLAVVLDGLAAILEHEPPGR